MRLWTLPILALPLFAQPSFEVASVHPSTDAATPAPTCRGLKLSPESTNVSGIHTLQSLVIDAYESQVDTFELLPPAQDIGHLAVGVKIPANTTVETCREMLRNLLAERLHLAVNIETREVSRFSVKVAKSGLKMKPVPGPPADVRASYTSKSNGDLVHDTFRAAPASRIRTAILSLVSADPMFRRVPFADFIDETGLTGYCDGDLDYTMPSRSNADLIPASDSLDEALRRQLGLTLELRKTPGKVLTIRSADRTPTEN